ncbi:MULTISPECIES: hypothetical protein [Acidithiobacillus]|uniref:Uncharacterized protein n=2 Tax=Acidithiobacillus ferridurans TaxID=1232575 RepID=A0A8X8G7L9_ACIFI|nr:MULTISPECIES: hypothetical protein [Acidithiobacillus]MBU2715190.1 hypothetical protein [Acidithiobacillus ferridurans]MBU2721993.1 hypothetical protein [Acidithiobacillus ferridurans]MBU2727489.1 hypothetical protein [Acidithiobacillus ferridurans]BBF66700.1 hypothetical protein AFERRID_29180 [Acidithiobacillus ferridurans]
MSAAQKKTGAGTPAAHSNTLAQKHTSPRGRRAIFHLWTASRAVQHAALTADDLALIREALAEIAGVLG